MIEESTGLSVCFPVLAIGESMDEKEIRVSGSLATHYAPAATVVLDRTPSPGEGFIAKAGVVAGYGIIRLASPQNDEEFAQVLYAALRAADEIGLKTVVVAQPLGNGIAVAIRDRLKRASNSP
jgi:L-threonylcarbamoyladenylate synthase